MYYLQIIASKRKVLSCRELFLRMGEMHFKTMAPWVEKPNSVCSSRITRRYFEKRLPQG